MITTRLRKTFFDLSVHFIATAIACVWVYSFSGNPAYVVVLILGGIFIDLDHFIDYFLFFGPKFNLNDFFGFSYLESGKVYVFFHSWEIIFLLLAVGIYFSSSALLIFCFGLSLHLAIDNLQRKNPFIYFLSYRIAVGFDRRRLLPEMEHIFKQ